jgi:hypothetical protein
MATITTCDMAGNLHGAPATWHDMTWHSSNTQYFDPAMCLVLHEVMV